VLAQGPPKGEQEFISTSGRTTDLRFAEQRGAAELAEKGGFEPWPRKAEVS